MKILNINQVLNNISEYQIINLNDKLLNKKYLLNTNKSSFTYVEKIVFDIANYHCIKNEKSIQDLFVEFYFEKPNNNNFFQYKKNNELFLSTITVLDNKLTNNIDTNNIDTNNNLIFESILTNISYDGYKYKMYDDFDIFLKNKLNKVNIAYLYKNTQLVSNSNNFIFNKIVDEENNTNLDDTIILYVNLWNKDISLEFFDENTVDKTFNKEDTLFVFSDCNYTEQSPILIKDNINANFYENILYKKNDKVLYFLKPLYENGTITKRGIIEVINPYNPNESINNIIKEKIGNLISDIEEVNNQKLTLNNRFLQRFHHNNVLDLEICNWIIHEAEKYAHNSGWGTNNFENYKTMDIKIENLKDVFNFFLSTQLQKIMKIIQNDYCLPKNTKMNIKDLNIIKYEKGLKTGIGYHMDAGFLTFNISLSDNSDYDGGGTLFEDGLIMQTNKGEMIVHSGSIKHKGIDITRGKRYIIVCVIDITVDINI